MKIWSITFASMATVALLCGSTAWSKPPGEQKSNKPRPQDAVECTGWHALCSLATDCSSDGYCACWRVDEQHVVVTADINDETFGGAPIKEQTQRRCTDADPCEVDEAPVCEAIKDLLDTGEWVSTYSYRGWCDNWEPVKCKGPWVDCMTAPCWEDSSNPDRPLGCQCKVKGGKFVGTNGTCGNSDSGTVMSTIRQVLWDFDNQTFRISMPGYDAYVKNACAPIESDPLPEE